MSGPFENRTGPHASAPAPSTRPQYEGTGKYDDRHVPAEAPAETPAEPEAVAPVEAAAAPGPAAPAAPAAASEASLRVLPMDLDELLGNAPTAPAAAVAPEPVAAAPEPVAAAPAASAAPGVKEASMSVLPVDIEALLGSKLGGG
jgi:hypothetical protein